MKRLFLGIIIGRAGYRGRLSDISKNGSKFLRNVRDIMNNRCFLKMWFVIDRCGGAVLCSQSAITGAVYEKKYDIAVFTYDDSMVICRGCKNHKGDDRRH